MADAKKCDVCGKLYELYNTKNGYNRLSLRRIDANGCVTYADYYDCCPECMKSIEDYLEKLGRKDIKVDTK